MYHIAQNFYHLFDFTDMNNITHKTFGAGNDVDIIQF